MIQALNSAYIKFLPKSEAFRRNYAPKIFDETVVNTGKMWATLGNPKRASGFSGFTTESGMHV